MTVLDPALESLSWATSRHFQPHSLQPEWSLEYLSCQSLQRLLVPNWEQPQLFSTVHQAPGSSCFCPLCSLSPFPPTCKAATYVPAPPRGAAVCLTHSAPPGGTVTPLSRSDTEAQGGKRTCPGPRCQWKAELGSDPGLSGSKLPCSFFTHCSPVLFLCLLCPSLSFPFS